MISRLIAIGMLAAGWAAATPLTITVSGTGSGTLGGRPFTSAAFSFTLTSDTGQLTKPPCCSSLDTPSGTPTTFSIAGAGSGTLTDNQAIFVLPNEYIIGLAHFNDGDMIDLSNTSLSAYSFGTSLGPLTGTPSFVGSCPGPDCTSFATSAGSLSFSSVSTVTFNIVVGAPPPASPTVTKVVDRAASSTRLAPGVPIEIMGSGFGTSAADTVTISIGGKTAPVSFVNATDLLSQVPVDAPVGSATLTVTYKGVTSQAFNLTIDPVAPEIYPPSASMASFTVAGNPVDAAHPATPGAQVATIAHGLGPTNPPQATNTTARNSSPTTMPVQVMLGNKLVMPDYAGLLVGGAPGTYQVLFKVPTDAPAGAQPVTLTVGGKTSNTVTLNVGSPIPLITAIVNGATFRAKGAAPNSFVSIFGANFGALDTHANIFPTSTFNGLSVLFNGLAAPMYYVFGSLGQINLVVPSELPETGMVSVQVKTALGTSAPFQLQMAAADVGLFRIPDPSKATRNNGAVLFANTVWRVMPTSMAAALGFPACSTDPAVACGQPATINDVIQVFLTGAGKATPDGDPAGQPLSTGSVAPANGQPLYRTVQTPTVTIGGIPATVSFSGITPGNAGLYQINVTVPPGVQPGDDVPIVVTMPTGNTDTVTIAIRAN